MKKTILILILVFTSLFTFSQSIDSTLSKLPDEVKSVTNSLTSDTAKVTFSKIYGDVKAGISGLASALKNGKGRTWAGRCEFIGTNPFFPSWELQVVISRTPVTNVKINSIHLSK